jgi:hypothetical protein
MLKFTVPEHPSGSSGGPLSPSTDYLAIYREGEPAAAIVIVMRFPDGTRHAIRSSISSSLHARGDTSPESTTITRDEFRVAFVDDAAQGMLRIQEHDVPLRGANLVMFEVQQNSAVDPSSIRAQKVALGGVTRGYGEAAALLAFGAVREFVGLE